MGSRIPIETLYIMVSQKVPTGTPTQARRYCEALQEVIYEQLIQNDACYWHGFGNFEKSISSSSGKYSEVQNFGTGRRETMWIDPKYKIGFTVSKNVVKGLNDGEEKIPRKKSNRKYKRRSMAQEVHYEKIRKKPEPLDKWLDGLMTKARYAYMDNEEEIDDGEERYDED